MVFLCNNDLDLTALPAGKLKADAACVDEMINKKAEKYTIVSNGRNNAISKLAIVVSKCLR